MMSGDFSGAAAYPTATLHEAYGGRGAFPSVLRPIDPRRPLFGRALTVEAALGDNLWIHRALLEVKRGDVLVCTVGGDFEHGYWGEILTVAAMARGVAGLVIDGGVRDAGRIEALGFPVFCRCLCIRGTTKGIGAGRIGGQVKFGDCIIETGDLIAGDRDGLVAVKASDVDAVAQASAAREAKEAAIIERLRAGESTMQVYGWS
ncbi:RraA family protein [soil metagenome]